MIADSELGTSSREEVTKMDAAIHIGVRKGHKELPGAVYIFVIIDWRLCHKSSPRVPILLPFLFDSLKPRKALHRILFY